MEKNTKFDFNIFSLPVVTNIPVQKIQSIIATLLLLGKKKGVPSHISTMTFSAAVGFLGFSFFRLVLFSAFRDNLAWYIIWEEITELLYISGTATVLWIFRGKLNLKINFFSYNYKKE